MRGVLISVINRWLCFGVGCVIMKNSSVWTNFLQHTLGSSPPQRVALVSCSCLTQQMGAAFRESSVLFLMVAEKKSLVLTTISFKELVICMYDLVKHTCSLRHESFIFTVTKSINYSGSANCYAILSHAPTTENKHSLNTVWNNIWLYCLCYKTYMIKTVYWLKCK